MDCRENLVATRRALLRGLFLDDADPVSLGAAIDALPSWDALLELAHPHGVLPALAWTLEHAGLLSRAPTTARTTLTKARLQCALQNHALLDDLHALTALGRPIVLGTSRKSFLGRITGRETAERMPATLATVVMGLERGAEVFRVHDVAPARDALAVAAATLARRWPSPTTTTTTTTT